MIFIKYCIPVFIIIALFMLNDRQYQASLSILGVCFFFLWALKKPNFVSATLNFKSEPHKTKQFYLVLIGILIF